MSSASGASMEDQDSISTSGSSILSSAEAYARREEDKRKGPSVVRVKLDLRNFKGSGGGIVASLSLKRVLLTVALRRYET